MSPDKLTANALAKILGLSRAYVARACQEGIIPASAWEHEKGKYYIDPVAAADALGRELPESFRPNTAASTPRELHPQAEAAKRFEAEPGSMPTAVVKNKRERIRLQMDALELQRMQGTLVSKEQVYKDLFEFGSTMRSRLQSIPAAIVDDVMAAKTRLAAFRIIEDAITKALDELTRMDDINLGKRKGNE